LERNPQTLAGTFKRILLLAIGGFAFRAGAASLTLDAVADTSLLEVAPSNNNGGQAFVISGAIQNPPADPNRTRALYRFDLTYLPTNTRIESVALELTVTKQPGDGLVNSAFGLHRMLRSWGEGNKEALTNPGQGLQATAGEATWLHRFFPTNPWATPGGEPDVDFVSSESAFQLIYGAGDSYRFESTPELVADVQQWVNDPASNFGWMLNSDDEGTPFTARHFGSREDASAHPNLEIQFFVPPRIESAQRVGGEFQLSFTTWPGQSYEVEFRDALATGVWQSLTNTGLATNITQRSIADPIIAPQRFYRVVAF
jgi:hypothetical protein